MSYEIHRKEMVIESAFRAVEAGLLLLQGEPIRAGLMTCSSVLYLDNACRFMPDTMRGLVVAMGRKLVDSMQSEARMSDATDSEKNRAIAQYLGHVWPVTDWPGWADPLHSNEREVGYVLYKVWPQYHRNPQAFVRLLQHLAELPGDEVGYSLGECDCRDDCTDHVAQIFYETEHGWTCEPSISACPMTALRDAVYVWLARKKESK